MFGCSSTNFTCDRQTCNFAAFYNKNKMVQNYSYPRQLNMEQTTAERSKRQRERERANSSNSEIVVNESIEMREILCFQVLF